MHANLKPQLHNPGNEPVVVLSDKDKIVLIKSEVPNVKAAKPDGYSPGGDATPKEKVEAASVNSDNKTQFEDRSKSGKGFDPRVHVPVFLALVLFIFGPLYLLNLIPFALGPIAVAITCAGIAIWSVCATFMVTKDSLKSHQKLITFFVACIASYVAIGLYFEWAQAGSALFSGPLLTVFTVVFMGGLVTYFCGISQKKDETIKVIDKLTLKISGFFDSKEKVKKKLNSSKKIATTKPSTKETVAVNTISEWADKILGYGALTLHIFDDAANSAQGAYAQTQNWFVALFVLICSAISEFIIDFPSIANLSTDNRTNDKTHKQEHQHEQNASEHKVKESNGDHHSGCEHGSSSIDLSRSKLALLILGLVFSMCFGLCIAVMAYYMFPQLMAALGVTGVVLSPHHLLVFIPVICVISIAGLGNFFAFSNSFLSMLKNDEEQGHNHELHIMRDYGLPVVTGKNRFDRAYVLRMVLIIALTVTAGIVASLYLSPLITGLITFGTFCVFSCVHRLYLNHRNNRSNQNTKKKSWKSRIGSFLVAGMAFISSMVTGAVGALLFAKLMGFGVVMILLQTTAAVITEAKFYKENSMDFLEDLTKIEIKDESKYKVKQDQHGIVKSGKLGAHPCGNSAHDGHTHHKNINKGSSGSKTHIQQVEEGQGVNAANGSMQPE